ncbi:peptide deformylase [Agrobacterium vitis]|uniref:Peptide deformylase-like n=1 Tax=Agrobacterium vitis TaxID=373 RepID=A0A368NWJ3_AGRVI|nr:peptide deformylase [Agrobacterium vitis]KAA3516108.1 peptide deformylase [Agrobacterium vitis]KAA3525732.1 peptide deformylase [Agrobacterium vitis]MCF1478729.1 peptide deformylase [Agrobacterium vitis]MUZ95425.1 peptide deformylase [Agrobacterium vitis]MVA31800.1 peptide deformylase [Agrobacterium vitis]
MALKILRYPHPLLAKPCQTVTAFDATLIHFADALYDAMRAAPGVGITAAHVGESMRLVILDLLELGGRRDYVNPEILFFSQSTLEHDEGSVCMPGMTETVTRPRQITLRYQSLDGTVHEEELQDFAAICMQHEIDQLDGLFWIQRLSRLKRDRLLKKWQKAISSQT